jgi:hypothetical protein
MAIANLEWTRTDRSCIIWQVLHASTESRDRVRAILDRGRSQLTFLHSQSPLRACTEGNRTRIAIANRYPSAPRKVRRRLHGPVTVPASKRNLSTSRNPTPRRAPNDAPRPRLQGTGAGAAGKPPCAPRTRPSRMPECRTCGTNREKKPTGRVGSPGWAVSGQTSQAGHAAFHARTPQVPNARAASHDDLR